MAHQGTVFSCVCPSFLSACVCSCALPSLWSLLRACVPAALLVFLLGLFMSMCIEELQAVGETPPRQAGRNSQRVYRQRVSQDTGGVRGVVFAKAVPPDNDGGVTPSCCAPEVVVHILRDLHVSSALCNVDMAITEFLRGVVLSGSRGAGRMAHGNLDFEISTLMPCTKTDVVLELRRHAQARDSGKITFERLNSMSGGQRCFIFTEPTTKIYVTVLKPRTKDEKPG